MTTCLLRDDASFQSLSGRFRVVDKRQFLRCIYLRGLRREHIFTTLLSYYAVDRAELLSKHLFTALCSAFNRPIVSVRANLRVSRCL